MPSHRRLYWLPIGVLLILAVVGFDPSASYAQAAATVFLTSPEISEFPRLSAYLDVLDAQGGFVSGLTPADVIILEDGLELPVTELQEQRPGVQFVLAITPGSALDIRDSQGITRYQHLLSGILEGSWDKGPTGQDDFSLLTSDGVALIHTADPGELALALGTYLPPVQGVPNLEVLAQALEVATDPLPRPGMARAVLFISPPQMSDITAGLQTLIARANQGSIHIFVWLVASADYFDLPGAAQLASPAEQTGGGFFAYSGFEPIPDLESYLAPLRLAYRLVYESRVSAAGPHQLAAQVNLPDGALLSASQAFEISLQPPTPQFVSPPVLIARGFASTPTAGQPAAADLIPIERSLSVSVLFPDGYDRPLTRTTLYVDGVVVSENSAAPFENFTWDLRSYTADGLHTLRVEAMDNLGLTGQSPDLTVQVTVPRPEQGVIVAFERQRLLVVGLVVLIAGSVLALVLIVGGRIRPQVAGLGRASHHQAAKRLRDKDPVTQPVSIQASELTSAGRPSPLKVWIEKLQRTTRPAPPQPFAFLIPLAEAGSPTLPAPFLLDEEPVSLGRDPLQARLVINDPSVDGLHARLQREQGAFRLLDAGSVAGTWVNYTPVPPDGVILAHADLVHLGRCGFRFTLREPGPLPKPTVQLLEPPL